MGRKLGERKGGWGGFDTYRFFKKKKKLKKKLQGQFEGGK